MYCVARCRCATDKVEFIRKQKAVKHSTTIGKPNAVEDTHNYMSRMDLAMFRVRTINVSLFQDTCLHIANTYSSECYAYLAGVCLFSNYTGRSLGVAAVDRNTAYHTIGCIAQSSLNAMHAYR